MELLLDLLERCEKLDVRGWYRAKEELAALREAGEKMARMLKYVNDMNKQKEIDLNDDWLWAQNSKTGKEILSALAKWEAANK